MSDHRQRLIIQVFRKYSFSVGPEVVEFLEDVLERHEIEDEDAELSLETLAKEYTKQDDAEPKVNKDILQRVYEAVQDQGNRTSAYEKEALDPDSHLYLIDAFEMPQWNWSPERGTFEKSTSPQTSSGSAESRVLALRNRFHIIRQCVLRNEHFAPSTLPSRDRERLVTLKSTKQLLGRAGERFLLLGMLVHSKEGKLCIEDVDGNVPLDFSKLDEPGEGLFTEGCFALVEGEYSEEGTLEIIAMGHPPCEPRETTRSIYGHIDFLGKGATSLTEDVLLARRVRRDFEGLNFFFLSDVWLDHPQTLPGLQRIFDNCVEKNFIPKIIVLCGDFMSRSINPSSGRDLTKYQEHFEALSDLIASYPLIIRSTRIVLVPGPQDQTINGVLPRRPILSSAVSRMKARIPHVHLGTNPCRIKFFNQEIVIFRENTLSRMLRNLVGVKPDARNDDLKRYLVQSILDQSHLTPFTAAIQPTLTEYDHALRLYPLPTALVLADKYERYKVTYSGCHVFNPGSFIGTSLGFSTYTPIKTMSEECVLDLEAGD